MERPGFPTISGAVNAAERMPVETGKSIGHSTADDPDHDPGWEREIECTVIIGGSSKTGWGDCGPGGSMGLVVVFVRS